jgi:hypothetical protein
MHPESSKSELISTRSFQKEDVAENESSGDSQWKFFWWEKLLQRAHHATVRELYCQCAFAASSSASCAANRE